MKTLNSDSSVPLYQQLKQLIQDDIQNGTYKRNEKIPTEQAFSQMYQVSRITVRRALEELTQEQLLVRIPGKGTFLAPEKLHRGIEGIQSFTQICLAAGKQPGAKVMRAQLEEARPDDREFLLQTPDKQVVVIERIRYADGIPVSYDISRLPQQYSFLLTEQLNDRSMFQLLKDQYQVEFVQTQKQIQLIYATREQAHHLGLTAGYPLISIRSLSFDLEGKPAHYSIQLVVGDRFTFTL